MRKDRGRKPINEKVGCPHLTIEYDKELPVDDRGFPVPISVESAKDVPAHPVRAMINNAAGYSGEEIESKLEAGW